MLLRGVNTLTFYVSISSHQDNQVQILQQQIQQMVLTMQQSKIDCSLDESKYGDRYFFACGHPASIEEYVCHQISQLLTKYFFTHIEKELVHQLIVKQYQSSYPHDMDEIEERTYQRLRKMQQEHLACQEQIAKHIYYFLSENHHLAIDGYIHFGMKPFKKWLSKYVQEAIDEYLLDREYKEFIELLKYFVSIQKPRFVCVHVIHHASKTFKLLKEDGTPIVANELDGTFHEMIGHSFSGEDFIVGALLSTAPEHVILHTNKPDENVIRTLVQIFDERITICSGCHTCL